MAKIMTVEEALESMRAKKNAKGEDVINRFSKKNFNTLMLALANDVDFTEKVSKTKGDTYELEDVMVTKGFRKWCKRLVEKFGVDSSESEVIMSKDFTIDNVDGLYEFFSSALYMYMEAGNRFDLPSKEDFQGGIYLKSHKESKKEYDAKNPATGEFLGKFETTYAPHKTISAKSSCPGYLAKKKKK